MINCELKGPWGETGWWNSVDYDLFRKFWPSPDMPDEKPENTYSFRGPFRLSYEEANNLMAMGVQLEIKALPGAMVTKMNDDKSWDRYAEVTAAHLNSGQAVKVTVADFALLLIDEVTYIDDAYTDMVQSYLNEGWRILAVCPPNGARRPDYIFGRKKPLVG